LEINSINVAAAVVNSEFIIEIVNNQMCVLFDYESTELVGSNINILVPDE